MTLFDEEASTELCRFHRDATGVLRATGEIDLSNADRLREALRDAEHPSVPTVVDMAGVSFLDSTGLTALLEHRLDAHGLTILNPSPQVTRVLRMASVLDLFVVEQTPAASS